MQGNYSEGFGAEDPKKKWAAKSAGESADTAPTDLSTAVAEAEQEKTPEPEEQDDVQQEVESVPESAHVGLQDEEDLEAARETDVEEVKVAEDGAGEVKVAEDDQVVKEPAEDDVENVESVPQAVPEPLSAEEETTPQDKPSPAQVVLQVLDIRVPAF